MEPRDRALDHPSTHAEPAAVRRPPLGEHGHDAACPRRLWCGCES
jgi:hypothetical protein